MMRTLGKVAIGIFSSVLGILLALGIRTVTVFSKPSSSITERSIATSPVGFGGTAPGFFRTTCADRLGQTDPPGLSPGGTAQPGETCESNPSNLSVPPGRTMSSAEPVEVPPQLPTGLRGNPLEPSSLSTSGGPSSLDTSGFGRGSLLAHPLRGVPRVASQSGENALHKGSSASEGPTGDQLQQAPLPGLPETAHVSTEDASGNPSGADVLSALRPNGNIGEEGPSKASGTAPTPGIGSSSFPTHERNLTRPPSEGVFLQVPSQPAFSSDRPTFEPGDHPNLEGSVHILPVGQSRQAPGQDSPLVAPTTPGGKQLIIEVQNEDIRKVLELLARHSGTSILLGKSVQGSVTASLHGVDLQTALEALVRATGFVARRYENYIFVGTAEECDRFDQLHSGVGLRVYRPRFVSAKELESLFRPLLTAGVGTVTVSSPPEIGISGDPTRTGGDSYAGGDLVIVRDYETVLTQLDELVAKIDVKPPQVAIEAMILAVRLDDEDRIGINFELFRDKPRFRLGWENPPASLANIRFDAGLKVAFLDGSVASFVSALQQIRETNVIAAPRLLVLNKHRADIQIGKEQGYVSTTITETAASQSVEFLQTGTLLRIRPFVMGENTIRLEVHPELSDGEVRELAGFTVPQKDITQVTTNVLVPNGTTVVIGGLIRRELSSGGSQIPLLGNLPWIGAIFRNRAAQQLREEIIVLITPHIIRDEEAAQQALAATERFERQFTVASEFATPLGRQNVAKRFCRLAQAAWNRGDIPRARRMAELALHFDPTLEEALAIREATECQATSCPQSCRSPSGLLSPRPALEEIPQPRPMPAGIPGANLSTPQSAGFPDTSVQEPQELIPTSLLLPPAEMPASFRGISPGARADFCKPEVLPQMGSITNMPLAASEAMWPAKTGALQGSGSGEDPAWASSVINPVYWSAPGSPVPPPLPE